MHLNRTIWNVGHGAFYTEIFADVEPCFVAVYDCGGSYRQTHNNHTKVIESSVELFLTHIEDRGIDLVFISHFHRDHINGVQQLINAGKVKQLVVPHLHKDYLLESFVYNAITDNANAIDVSSEAQNLLIKLANNRMEERIVLTEVKPAGEGNEEKHADLIPYEQFNNMRNIQSGTPILVPMYADNSSKKRIDWVYIPVNADISDNKTTALRKKIETAAQEKGESIINKNGEIDFDKLGSILVKIGIKKLKKIYADVFDAKGNKSSKHNSYSMPVFSGLYKDNHTEIADIRIYPPYKWFYWPFYHARRTWIKDENLANCLYMGDFETEKKIGQLRLELGGYYSKARLQQVPHHFSNKGNHNKELYCYRTFAFGNVDGEKDDSFSPKVHNEIIRQNCIPFVVTEEECIKFIYRIY